MNSIKNLFFLICIQIIVIFQTASVNSNFNRKLYKCCPDNYQLDRRDEQFLCIPYVSNNDTLFGYNLEISEKIKIPECPSKRLFKFDYDGGLLSIMGCVDFMHNDPLTIYGITCSDLQQIIVHRLMKCCPKDYLYDVIERECTFTGNDTDQLLHGLILDEVGLFRTMLPNCSENEVFVEYNSNTHIMTLDQSDVRVQSLDGKWTDYLQVGSFCVDAVPPATNNSTFLSVIIRSCRPSSICDKIACVRRCCRADQMLERQNGTTICQDYEKNIKPIFYDVNLPLEIDKPQGMVELNGTFFFIINCLFQIN